MPVMTVTEFRGIQIQPGGLAVQAVQVPPLRVQRVTFDGTSQATAQPLLPDTGLIRISLDANGFVRFGTGTPVADSAVDMPMFASVPEYFTVSPSGLLRVAAVS